MCYTDTTFVENSGTELKGAAVEKTAISQMPEVEKLHLPEQLNNSNDALHRNLLLQAGRP